MSRILKNSNLVIIVFFCLIVSVGAGKLWGQKGHTPGEPASATVLTQVKDILELTPEEAERGQPVRIRAVVTYYDHLIPLSFVQDPTGGIFVVTPSNSNLGLKSGDLVEIKGVTMHGWFRNQITKPQVQAVGRAPLPEPRRPRTDQLDLGRLDCQWVEITGIVNSTSNEQLPTKLILNLTVGSDHVKVSALNPPKSTRTDLLHAKVRIQGVCGGAYNPKHEMIGIIIYVPDVSFVHNLGKGPSTKESPPADSSRELASLNARH